MEREVRQGQFYRHFKNRLYQIIAVAVHSETREKMVVYQALYGNYGIYVRPYDMFVSEVDHVKYPDVTQKYRFELIKRADLGNTVIKQNDEAGEEKTKSTQQPEQIEQKRSVGASVPIDAGEVNPHLLEFLEAETYEEKLQIFTGLGGKIDDQLLNSIAASLDIVVEEGPFARRYQEVLSCLSTMKHFECNRFR